MEMVTSTKLIMNMVNMMSKDIQRVYKDNWDEDFTIPQHSTDTHPAYNSLGGSELYTINLFKNVPKEIRDRYNIIVSRWHEEAIDSSKPTIYIIQDLYSDPMYEHLRGNDWESDRIEKVIFVSHWQREMFQRYNYNIPPDRILTIHNAVEYVECDESKWTLEDDKDITFDITYTSTPQRGLAILFEACRALRTKRSDFRLNIFSGFDIYGFDDNNEPFKPLFEAIGECDWIVNHGVQPNEKVREHLSTNHIYAYPSIWEETSCMAVMEAMYGGNMIIASAHGALPETVANCGICYDQPGSPEEHVMRMAGLLDHSMNTYHSQGAVDTMKFGRAYADRFYSWKNRGPQWEALLRAYLVQIDQKLAKETAETITEEVEEAA